jgi:hypothetical protein
MREHSLVEKVAQASQDFLQLRNENLRRDWPLRQNGKGWRASLQKEWTSDLYLIV